MHASTAANVEAVRRGTRCTDNLECDPRCGYECDVEGENGPCPEALEVFGPAKGRVSACQRRCEDMHHGDSGVNPRAARPCKESPLSEHRSSSRGAESRQMLCVTVTVSRRPALRGSSGTTGVGLIVTLSALVARRKVARLCVPTGDLHCCCTARCRSSRAPSLFGKLTNECCRRR